MSLAVGTGPASVSVWSTARLTSSSTGPRKSDSDLLVRQASFHERRIRLLHQVLDRLLLLVRRLDVRLRGRELLAELVDLPLLDLLRRLVHAAARGDRHADHDPDREGDEDGRERGDVVAEVEHRAQADARAHCGRRGPRRSREGPARRRPQRRRRRAPQRANATSGQSPPAGGRAGRRRARRRASPPPSAWSGTWRTSRSRLRSRNSIRLKCVPTATISSAPFSYASSIARSSLIPGVGTSADERPSRSSRDLPGALPSS